MIGHCNDLKAPLKILLSLRSRPKSHCASSVSSDHSRHALDKLKKRKIRNWPENPGSGFSISWCWLKVLQFLGTRCYTWSYCQLSNSTYKKSVHFFSKSWTSLTWRSGPPDVRHSSEFQTDEMWETILAEWRWFVCKAQVAVTGLVSQITELLEWLPESD